MSSFDVSSNLFFSYPEHAPLVRMPTPHVSGGHVLSLDSVCYDVFLPDY
jgi:hypothetical protein